MMGTIDLRRPCVLLACLLISLFAHAHKASDAYVTLAQDGSVLHGQWDIALRDLDAAIGLDAGAFANFIAIYAFFSLVLERSDLQRCRAPSSIVILPLGSCLSGSVSV